MTKTPIYFCPECQKPLLTAVRNDGCEVWCGNLCCKSTVSNDGAEGATFKEAFDLLCRNISKEKEENS